MMSLRICVDKLDDITFVGKIVNVVEDPIPFANFQDFIVKIDKFLDVCGHPQSSIEKRSMKEEKNESNRYSFDITKVRDFSEIQKEVGQACTFDLDIQTRNRGDWQGRVRSVHNEYIPFSNVLDLMDIITTKICA